ncbi:MAG: bifunctional UDP-N-acetylmuramoyl-tripeptide:D-alanyl-D-alanine ligase/alanine racemase [Saprospiraceae bacterium]|nr:bifunctional UDP-N-acetylmuramoyl-tripeptide:D-alanyl-D-alanine ligase/alanine racemase [Saprospiraceae bacterium]
MKYEPTHIAQILGADPASILDSNPIDQICLDSRQIIFPERALFFALTGQRRDGHDFVQAAYKQGVRNFVLAKTFAKADLASANVFRVDSPLRALQKLATYHRQQFHLPVIGITGSNGKTIVKEWLFQLLGEDFHSVRSPKSYNSQIGVPLSVLQIEESHQLGIFEAGISQRDEMKQLAPIIDCQIGIFTYVGDAHREGFHSRQEKVSEKLALFRNAQTLVYNLDDPLLDPAIQKELPHIRRFNWSTGPNGTLHHIQWEQHTFGSTLQGKYKQQEFRAFIPFSDTAARTNALHCLATLLLLEYTIEEACHRLQNLQPVEMRLEMKAGINQTTIINDAYNADLASLTIALQFLDQQSPEKKRTLILSDLLQTGRKADKLYQKVAALLREKRINQLIGIGTQIIQIQAYLPADIAVEFYPGTSAFLKNLDPGRFQQETILLKGARAFAFEQIAERLALQVHNTVLEINLNAIRHNLEVFHRQLAPTTRLLVMVKAAAYGSGAYEIARLLEFQRVDYLGVAYADEGIELRKAGITLPILVLNPETGSFQAMKRYKLEPEVYSLEMLKRWIGTDSNTQVPGIHLKLETGMNRLGLTENELPEIVALLKQHPALQVLSVFSHLAASESPESDDFSHTQARRFEKMVATIQEVTPTPLVRHLLNSSGIARFPEYQYEMVRLGIGIYGQESSRQLQGALQPVFSLKARLSQIKNVGANETIGYGRKGTVTKPTAIGVISIGYADGLLRLAGNGRYALQIRGKEAPIIGNVCMDMCMVDLDGIPEACEGDEVLVFGPEKSVELLSKALKTIPYEVFTNISSRVKRIYVQE